MACPPYTQSVLQGTNGILTVVLSLIFQYTFLTAFGQNRLVSYLAVPYSLSLIKHTVCNTSCCAHVSGGACRPSDCAGDAAGGGGAQEGLGPGRGESAEGGDGVQGKKKEPFTSDVCNILWGFYGTPLSPLFIEFTQHYLLNFNTK